VLDNSRWPAAHMHASSFNVATGEFLLQCVLPLFGLFLLPVPADHCRHIYLGALFAHSFSSGVW
jgi:hypothetical protein